MRIEWINHSSFVLDHAGVRMICDPWLDQSVFADGWSLLARTAFAYDEFREITHIWFSHEHPDHFSPRNLRNIDQRMRANIKVLYMPTDDKKVVDFCKDLGFKEVIELPPSQWFTLGDDVRVMVTPHGHDSWMCIETSEGSILNLNDCGITAENMRPIRSLVGNVDVLAVQFSYAQWEGNEEDVEARKRAGRRKLAAMSIAVDAFSPRYVIPFASYVWFSHEENYYLNDSINRIDGVYRYLAESGVQPVVLYPSESWTVGSDHDSQASIAQYQQDYRRVFEAPELTKATSVDLAELFESADRFLTRARERLPLWELIWARSIKIYLTDYDKAFKYSFVRGMKEIGDVRELCDIAMSSEAWDYAMRYDWGLNSIHVGARFQIPRRNGMFVFGRIESIARMLNHGIRRSFARTASEKVWDYLATIFPMARRSDGTEDDRF